MRFEFEEDEDIGYLDIIVSKRDLVKLLDEDMCETELAYRNNKLLKMKVNICIRKEDDAA